MTLQPPNATPLQRALAEPLSALSEIPAPLRELWNPRTMPIELLPWLAWALNVDRWDSDWSEATKRDAVANAIPVQRRKGTVASVKQVLASFDELLTLTEWWQQSPRGAPYTSEIRLPMDGAGGVRSTAAFAEAIVRDVMRVKPVRSHFTLTQTVEAAGQIGVMSVGRAALYRRDDGIISADTSQPWADFLQTETGEPLQLVDGEYIEDHA